MNHHSRISAWLLLVGLLSAALASTGPAFGQDEFDDEAPAAAPARAERPTPRIGPATDDAEPEGPAVLTILESNPTTPAELVNAVVILNDLGRPALAKPLLKRLLAAPMDGKAQAALITQFGSSTFMRMAQNESLAPEAAQFTDKLLAGVSAYRQDPRRLAAWAKQLSADSADARAEAIIELSQSHGNAVAPLTQILGDPARGKEHAAAHEMLARLGGDAVQPLLGVLESDDAPLKAAAARVLGELRAKVAINQLVAPAVAPSSPPELKQAASHALFAIAGAKTSVAEGKKLLEYEVQSRLERSLREAAYDQAPITVWQWDAAKKASVPVQYRPADAEAVIAARLGRDLLRIDPSDAGFRRLYLTGLLEAAKYRHGLEKPLPKGEGTVHAAASAFGVEAIDDALGYAMATGHIPAATAAAQILGDIAEFNILVRVGGRNSPLADAARNNDRRLRFAAVGAIIKLDPRASFAGSAAVSDALGYFCSSYGSRRALVAHPRGEKGQWIAGLLNSQGFDVDLATNGRRAFELATSTPDYEMIWIHVAIARPDVDNLIVQLRKDPRTARLPIGVIEILEDKERAERLARRFPAVIALAEPQDEEAVKSQTEWLLSATRRSNVSHEERRQHALAALEWLGQLADAPPGVYDLRRQVPAVMRALYVPEVSDKVAIVLGKLGTAPAQRALAELASRPTQPLPVRQAAALAFKGSVARHGILLTSGEVNRQYTEYNASAKLDTDTQAVLASILDTLERKEDSDQTSVEQ